MAILAFQKPEKVIMLESTSSFGKFEFRPLEPGFGMTVGNALRRILLSSLEGYAITTVKVAGVDHEFAAIPGVMEDMLNIILNLKQVRFIRTVDNQDAEKVSINVAGVTELTAGYISNYLSFFKVLNPDLVICHLAPGTKMQMTLTIGKGRGYVPAEENAPAESEFGTLPIDSIFTPIKNVKYSIENYRVEQKTDYEKLNLEITTDGSIHPKEALKEAAKILIQHFMLFSDEKITVNMEDTNGAEEFDEDVLHMRQLLKTKLSDQDLSVRALNCLKAADVDTVGDLVKLNRNDLLKFRNFGKKSLTELTAGYISNYLSFFKVLNPDLVICHLAPGTKMQMTLTIGKGRGYVSAEENTPAECEFGTLPIDSIFTPIKNVKYSIDNYRVEQKTDYEKLNLEITTDGSIHPKEALKEAAKILIQHFMLFSDEKITVNMEDTNGTEEFDEDVLHMRQLLKTKLSDQDLSVRALNCLKAADVDTVGDLVKLNRNDLLKFRNFGKKSLTELDELLTSLNLKFGMDVSIYKLDKD